MKSLWTAENLAAICLEEAQQIINTYMPWPWWKPCCPWQSRWLLKIWCSWWTLFEETFVQSWFSCRSILHALHSLHACAKPVDNSRCPPSFSITRSCWNQRQYLCLSTRIRRIYYPPTTPQEEWVCEFLPKKFADFFFATLWI